jgi:CMP-N-acetylneuraminic acid synthetase
MKKLKVLSLIVSVLFIQTLAAQSPAISAQYSNEEIAQIVEKYRVSNSYDAVPPAGLQQKFQVDFPKAYDVEWETANDIYEVEFEIRFRDFKVLYDKNGNLLIVKEEIRRSELPAIVKNAAESKYPKYTFEDIDKIRCGTEILYKVEMECGESEVKLLIKSDGSIFQEKFDY